VTLPSYSEYFESGLEWFGDVPRHWTVAPVKHRAQTGAGSGFPHEYQAKRDGAIPFLKVNALAKADADGVIRWSDETISETDARALRATIFPGGSIVLAKIGAALLLGRIRILGSDSCIDNNMMAISPRADTNSRFLYYAMTQLRFDWLVNPGAVPSTSEGAVGRFRLPFPTVSEQTSIADFLDKQTSKIDLLIRKQERLLETLAERRQAIISQAVTKGLDSSAPMRDSGIGWLGSISEDWEAVPLNRLLRTPLKYGANEAAVHDNPTWPRYIRITDFGADGALRDATFRSLPPEVAREYPLQGGDILLARSGATAGKSFLVPDDIRPSCYAGYLIRVALNRKRALPRFLSYFLASAPFAEWRALNVIQATIENISAEKYARMVVPVPPIGEQICIIGHLDRETAHIDALSAKAREMISLLKERRQALISAAVTGKIDVRGLS
jgi:type I restriction enzyme S subunit